METRKQCSFLLVSISLALGLLFLFKPVRDPSTKQAATGMEKLFVLLNVSWQPLHCIKLMWSGFFALM
jgi:hypothetical protein